ncbi:MAG: hypothetical protein P0Y55_15790 [Candidatus Cohnella colombiensis]|uniref:Uncharacterized protein n=1 Tax=Candidatus Cohnella colombiensis TaxID=3121368 RepID=A0AA95EW72_9BACL|nr:MAG: hypothetical protein P0Y55_15790 [Cohnella sp.]
MKNREMARVLKWMAMIAIVVGIVVSIMNIAQFNDRNLGLMIGIGFLIGGVQIMMFGIVFPLFQKNQELPLVAASPEEAV